MGWHRPNEDSRADYEHDQRKNWSPDIPIRLEPGPHSTAMDIALIVSRMTNFVEAGKLIDQYARTNLARALLDDTMASVGNKQRRRYAVASLIGECEALCASGDLSEQRELTLRKLVADALSAHGMSAANREERVEA